MLKVHARKKRAKDKETFTFDTHLLLQRKLIHVEMAFQ